MLAINLLLLTVFNFRINAINTYVSASMCKHLLIESENAIYNIVYSMSMSCLFNTLSKRIPSEESKLHSFIPVIVFSLLNLGNLKKDRREWNYEIIS